MERLKGTREIHRNASRNLFEQLDVELEARNKIEVEVLIAQMKDRMKKIEIINEKILEKITNNDYSEEIEEQEEFNALYIRRITNSKSILAEKRREKDGPERATTFFDSDYTKLPPLQIPKFGGKLLEWTTFWSIFDASVHSKQRVSKIAKFSRLIDVLEGRAKKTSDSSIYNGTCYTYCVPI